MKWAGRLRATIEKYLAEGSSPDQLSLAIALGITCGVFPVFGTTTAVTALAGLVFRVNPVVVQVFNYLMYPLYFLFMFGFILAGAWLFGNGLDHYSSAHLHQAMAAGVWTALRQAGWDFLHAVIVWCVLAPFAVLGLKAVAASMIKRWMRVRVATEPKIQ